MSHLSRVQQYITALMETGVSENVAHAQAILSLMDTEQAYDVFKIRCVCIPMHETTDGFGLVRSADRTALYSLLEDEGQLAEKPLAAEEVEAKVDQLLDVANHAFSDGDQPLLPTMMLGRARWLILYRVSDFDANKDLAGMENRPLANSLKQAQGEPGRWLFEHLDRQAAQRRAEHRNLHRGS